MTNAIRETAKLATAAALMALLAACAGKPKTVQTPVEAPQAEQAAPQTPYTPPAETPVATAQIKPGSVQDFVVNVGDRVFFDLDQYTVRADARSLLEAQASWLQSYPGVQVRIEGNADERGTREYNMALGARRAESVKEFLISKGVAGARISTISYGKENPIADGANEEAWSKNRNAHTAITGGAE